MNDNMFFKFLGSKWFMLALGVLMTLALPTTYKNLMVVYNAGAIGTHIGIPIVFVINLITVIMAFYSFSTKMFAKKDSTPSEW
jgi:hypothetical protein